MTKVKRKKYGSSFERTIHTKYLPEFNVHPGKIHFIRHANYEPDLDRTLSGFKYIIEDKAYFFTQDKTKFYLDFRDTLKENEEFIFIFQYPNKEIKWKPKRKDGTKMSVSQWATRNNVRWFCEQTIFLFMRELKNREKGVELEKFYQGR